MTSHLRSGMAGHVRIAISSPTRPPVRLQAIEHRLERQVLEKELIRAAVVGANEDLLKPLTQVEEVRLVELLEPDMILCSIARKHMEKMSFKRKGWEVSTSITKKKDGTPREKPYNVEVSEVTIGAKKAYLVYGQAVILPFGSLSLDAKYELGKELSGLLR